MFMLRIFPKSPEAVYSAVITFRQMNSLRVRSFLPKENYGCYKWLEE